MKSPQGTIAAITALAIALSEGKSSKELIYMAAMFTQLSNTLRTIAISVADLEGLDGSEKRD